MNRFKIACLTGEELGSMIKWYTHGTYREKGVAKRMVQITELAAQKVKEVLVNQHKENAFLRLYVAGFG